MKTTTEVNTVRGRTGGTCDRCEKAFTKNEQFMVVTTQTSWFRGDDVVENFCFECCDAKGIKVDPGLRRFEPCVAATAVANLLAARGHISRTKVGYWAKVIDWEFTAKEAKQAAKEAAKEVVKA